MGEGTTVDGRGADPAPTLMSAAFRQAPIAMAITGPDGLFLEVNDTFCELVGRRREELLSLLLDDVTHPDDVDRVRAGREVIVTTQQKRHEGRFRLLGAGKRPVPVSLSWGFIGEPDGYVEAVLVHAVDISRDLQRESELAYRALHDSLTGLPNRVLFLDRLEHALARLRRGESSVAVLFLDVDDFKAVNDRFGHETGDHVLAQAAHRLARAVRPGDTVARFGGDEFVILCEDSGASEAAVVAHRIDERWRSPISLPDGRQVALACSIGVALARSADTSADQLLRDADSAMYQAKGGRSAP